MAFDVVTYILSKKYADKVISELPSGFSYKGAVNYFKDLPVDAAAGDVYTVIYAGESGTEPSGKNYACGPDGSWIELATLQGPKGDKGDKGDRGPKGDKGDTGPQGPKGEDAVLPSFKTIEGESIIGEGNISIPTYSPFDPSWRSDTIAHLIADVNADENAVVGKSYLGEVDNVTKAEGLFNGNAEIVVNIMNGSGTRKVIWCIVSSNNVAPYHWEATFSRGVISSKGWTGYQPELVSGTNIKTINNISLLGEGNITTLQPEDLATVATSGSYNDLSDKPEPQIFIVNYNNPNFADAKAAFEAGKVVLLYGAAPDTNSYALINYVSNSYITFSKFLTSKHSTKATLSSYYLKSDNTWDLGDAGTSGSRNVLFNTVNANVANPTEALSSVKIADKVYSVTSAEVVEKLPVNNIKENTIYLVKNDAEPISIEGLVGTTWEFNDVLNLSALIENKNYKLSFKDANGIEYLELSRRGSQRLKYKGSDPDVYNNSWADVAYKTISIFGGDDVENQDILTFLEANAVKTIAPVMYSYDQYTYIAGEWRKLTPKTTVGPQGPQGPAGPQGPKGDKGDAADATMGRDFTTSIAVGHLAQGTAITANMTVSEVLYRILYEETPANIKIYYGATYPAAASVSQLQEKYVESLTPTLNIHITTGNYQRWDEELPPDYGRQFAAIAIPNTYQVTNWCTQTNPYPLEYNHVSDGNYEIYYLATEFYDLSDSGDDYIISISEVQ